MNPMGAGDVANVSLLRAGYHIGINTVGQSLRNANLQLRSEPANPQLKLVLGTPQPLDPTSIAVLLRLDVVPNKLFYKSYNKFLIYDFYKI